jgi:tetratricopeptide (TPR) repeat protein
MKISKKITIMFIMVSSFIPSLAYANRILDKVEVLQTKKATEIHVEFLTQIRYIRHFPNNKESNRIEIFLEFPQLNSLSSEREFLNGPKSEIVPSFVVNYPDSKNSSVGVRFKTPIKYTITPDNSGRGIVIHVPLDPKNVPIEAPAVSLQSAPEKGMLAELPAKPEGMTDQDYARQLMTDARSARGIGDYPKAVQLLNAVLNLPANTYSQEAQELIANSREKMGEPEKAKAEYEAYLKLYPQGEGAERVRQRLATIQSTAKVTGADTVKVKKPTREIHETSVYGSWNQYYYDAHTHNYPGVGRNSSSHDQSSLVSAINLTARSRQNEWDNRIVLRDTQTMNFLPNATDRNRLQAAYVEINNKEVDYLVRLGRQSGNSGGVLGRYDGALIRYGISPKYKINLVGGTLNEYYVDYKRHFYGINLDIGPINEKWSGNLFAINQTVDSVTDRRAVGGELRYFDNGRSFYSLLDYDLYFHSLNTIMLQGNWQADEATNYNILVDHRKSPMMQIISSLSSPVFSALPTFSIRQALRQGQTEQTLRDLAISQTLDTDLVLIGATRQFTPRWQIGGDVQFSRVSGGNSSAAEAAAIRALLENNTFIDPLTLQNLNNSFAGGNTWTYHVQAVGTDTLFKEDTSIISASLTNGPTSQIKSLVLSNVMVPREKWRLDSSLKLLRIDLDPSTVQYIVSPTLRASYKLREKATLEAEVGIELTNENDPINGHTRTLRDFSFIGYRLDI